MSGEERIAAAFEKAADEGRAALMPYMMAGYPNRETSLAVAAAYVDSGADLIELGVPFSDPLADEQGQILEAHSVSAGLDYPGVGPEHAYLRDTGRARYEAIRDDQALAALRELARLEGIIPALESSHAISWLMEHPGESGFDVLCLSGRGDKDLAEVVERTGG